MIRQCNIQNYTIFLREPENLLFSYFEYTGDDREADMARWRPTRKHRNGGPSACHARSRSPPPKRASGGRKWRMSSISTEKWLLQIIQI